MDIILNMRVKMQRMQEEITQFTEFLHRELSREDNALSERAKNALVRLPRRDMVPAGSRSDAGSAPGVSPSRPRSS